MIKTALTIAGSDSSGGAGIQADRAATMTAMHACNGMERHSLSLTAHNHRRRYGDKWMSEPGLPEGPAGCWIYRISFRTP